MKKLIVAACLGAALWGVVAWLFIAVPLFVVNVLPDLLPLAVFAFLLFLVGLLLLTITAVSVVRANAPRFTWTVVLMASFIIVLYNLSPLAPGWKCFGKRLYAATATAAGQNCTTTCTNNKKKPCGGWSSCWDKNISCSASGVDQDGRPCQGCCFSCDVVCEPDPSSDSPPTISATIACSQTGNNGWCIGGDTLQLTASDLQGYTLTISGDIDGTAFTCAAGATTCNKALPEGNGTINYKVTASQSGLTDNRSINWKKDVTFPTSNLIVPALTGSNGWFKTSPVAIAVSGADSLSGLAQARLSLDPNANRATWPSSISLNSDGIYSVYYGADDVAGNQKDYSPRLIYIDTIPPTFSPSVSGTLGSGGWYISQAVVTATATDATSGVSTILISDNGGPGKPSPVTLDDGVHNLTITATDMAGNSQSDAQIVYVDTRGPTVTPSISGTFGSKGWYTSSVDVDATAADAISGVNGGVEISFDGGTTWQSTPIALSDGIYKMILRAFDAAGNEGTDSLTVSVDTTPPDPDFLSNGTQGEHGWYVSPVEVSSSALDATSGVDSNAVRADRGGWATAVTVSDGVHSVEAQSTDQAGNTKRISTTLRVDTVSPSSSFSSHIDNQVASGVVRLDGLTSDSTSGVQSAEISVDTGTTWKPVKISNSSWSYDWDTQSIPNGTYVVEMRAIDNAGNRENPISLTLLVDNFPPSVKITDSWWIWESGAIKVSANSFSISEIKVTISDPQGRWPSMVLTYDPSTTSSDVTWDRRFSDGTVAPSGNYRVTALACDIYGNCASDRGVIKILFIALIPPTATPSPLPSPTLISTMTAVPSPIPNIPTVVQQTPFMETTKPFHAQPTVVGQRAFVFSTLAVVSLIALMWVLSSAALADPRPKAILAIAKTISQKRNS